MSVLRKLAEIDMSIIQTKEDMQHALDDAGITAVQAWGAWVGIMDNVETLFADAHKDINTWLEENKEEINRMYTDLVAQGVIKDDLGPMKEARLRLTPCSKSAKQAQRELGITQDWIDTIPREVVEMAVATGASIQNAMDAMKAFEYAFPTLQDIKVIHDQINASQTESDGIQSESD